MYHCTPPELAEIPLDTINDHLVCLNQEAEVRRMRQRTQRRKATLG